jgi:hypothetical protein
MSSLFSNRLEFHQCRMRDDSEDFDTFCWTFTDGKVRVGDGGPVPASAAKSEEISKELKRRGFKFVGPVIVYTWMQALGIVSEHAPGLPSPRGLGLRPSGRRLRTSSFGMCARLHDCHTAVAERGYEKLPAPTAPTGPLSPR